MANYESIQSLNGKVAIDFRIRKNLKKSQTNLGARVRIPAMAKFKYFQSLHILPLVVTHTPSDFTIPPGVNISKLGETLELASTFGRKDGLKNSQLL